MTILPFPMPPILPDVLLEPPGHPEGCICEWCMAVLRGSKARHPSVHRPPDAAVVDFVTGQPPKWGKRRVKIMASQVAVREDQRAADRKRKVAERAALKAAQEQAQRLEDEDPPPVLGLVKPDQYIRSQYRDWLAKEKDLAVPVTEQ